jgi:hypothetical protein
VVCHFLRLGFLNNLAQKIKFIGSGKKSQAYKNFFPSLQKKILRPTKNFYQA